MRTVVIEIPDSFDALTITAIRTIPGRIEVTAVDLSKNRKVIFNIDGGADHVPIREGENE